MSDRDRWWPHVDHDLSQLIALHAALSDPGFRTYPEHARRAMNVAYAAHFRTIMEFAHATRPKRRDRKPEDITSEKLLGSPLRSEWVAAEEARLADADKLVGHLSLGRLEREGMQRDWGCPEDLELWAPYCNDLLARAPDKLPRSSAAVLRSKGLIKDVPDPEWARAWYHVAVADVRWAKEQATAVTRWALLLLGGVLGFSATDITFDAFVYLTIIGVVSGAAVLWHVDLHLFARKARARAEESQRPVPEELRVGLMEKPRWDSHHVAYLIVHVVLILGATLLVWSQLP